jgi:hypothetical protein
VPSAGDAERPMSDAWRTADRRRERSFELPRADFSVRSYFDRQNVIKTIVGKMSNANRSIETARGNARIAIPFRNAFDCLQRLRVGSAAAISAGERDKEVRARCVRFVFGVAAASRNTRLQAARYGLTWVGLAPTRLADFERMDPITTGPTS